MLLRSLPMLSCSAFTSSRFLLCFLSTSARDSFIAAASPAFSGPAISTAPRAKMLLVLDSLNAFSA